METYFKIYELSIIPIDGRAEWSKADMPHIEAPLLLGGAKRGRPFVTPHLDEDEPPPKIKKRNGAPPLNKRTSQLRRQQRTIRCSNCRRLGHNKWACKNASFSGVCDKVQHQNELRFFYLQSIYI